MGARDFVIAGSIGPLSEHLARLAMANGARVEFSSGAFSPDAEVWYFTDGSTDFNLPFLPAVLNVVVTPYCGNDPARWLRATSAMLPDLSATRVFETSLTLDANPRSREGFAHLLATLFDLQTEIDERIDGYFEHRALRMHASPDAPVNLIHAERAASLMLSIAARHERGRFTIASPASHPLGDVVERIGAVLGISLLAEENRNSLNAIDALFDLRLAGLSRFLGAPERAAIDAACAAGGVDPASLVLDEVAQSALFEKSMASRNAERRAFLERAAALPDSMTRAEILMPDDANVAYYVSRPEHDEHAPALAIVNAFAQPLDFWFRLIEALRHRFTILIAAPQTDVHSIESAAQSLEAMLDREGIATCHTVAWCTGPRVAVEAALRDPERVRSLVLLNTSLRCTGGPSEYCSAFEKNFDTLMRMLESRPAMAPSIMASLQSSAGSADDLESLLPDPDEDVAERVLSRINDRLRSAVAAPFTTSEKLVQFVRGVRTFWDYDLRERIADLNVPVLVLSAEHDRVAEPFGSTVAAEMIPNSRRVHVPGATHYFLFDRPETTAALIETFVQDVGRSPID